MLDLLLTGPVISSLVVAACAAFSVSIVGNFAKDRTKLDKSLRKVDRILKKLRAQIAEKEIAVRTLQEELAKLRPQHDRLNDYFEVLQGLHVEAERQAIKDEDSRPTRDDDDDDLGLRRTRTRVDR